MPGPFHLGLPLLPLVAISASLLFGASVAYHPSLKHPMCIEGGEYAGFPVAFYIRCYGPPVPGDGPSVDAPIIDAVGLAVDAVLCYLTATLAVILVGRAVQILRRRF